MQTIASRPATRSPPPGLFVTGTDTDVGKTVAATAIVRSLVAGGGTVGVYKPVASGLAVLDEPGGDPLLLWEAAGRPRSLSDVCPQRFAAAIAPPRAAAAEGGAVDESLLRTGLTAWAGFDVVVVEAAGGLFSPLGTTTLGVDLARDLGFPLVVVDSARLGTIGRTLATVTAARASGLSVAACVLSQVGPAGGPSTDPASDDRVARDSLTDLDRLLSGIPVTLLPHGGESFTPPIDWQALAADRARAASPPPSCPPHPA